MTRSTDDDSSDRGSDSNGNDTIVSPTGDVKSARWAGVLFFAALVVYATLGILAHHYAYFGWDLSLARIIQAISFPGFDTLMVAVSFLGSWFAWPLVTFAALVLISKGLRIEGLVCAAGSVLGDLINLSFKFLIGRPRPTDLLINVTRVYQHDSFPSGHVVFFIEFFGFLFFLAYALLKRGLLRVTLLIVLAMLIGLVGISRVYLGAHWPSDVLGAYLAGGIWLTVVIEVYRRIKAKRAD